MHPYIYIFQVLGMCTEILSRILYSCILVLKVILSPLGLGAKHKAKRDSTVRGRSHRAPRCIQSSARQTIFHCLGSQREPGLFLNLVVCELYW